jgi:hypothetical protein
VLALLATTDPIAARASGGAGDRPAGALDQGDVEDELYAATRLFASVGADGQRQCWRRSAAG